MILTVIFSSMPIWLAALLATLLGDPQGGGFGGTLLTNMHDEVLHGEILLLASGGLSTVLYVALAEFSKKEQVKIFPGRLSHVICVILTLLLSSVVFFSGRGTAALSFPWLLNFSLFLYAFSLLLTYTASVYHNERIDFEGATRAETDAFQQGYANHRRGETT
jgi:hypothetical protein